MIYLMFLLGGFGRAVVGVGHSSKLLSRWSVYPPIALLSAYVGLAPTLDELEILHLATVFWVALIVSLNLAVGYTQWESWKWMALRFGLPSLVLILPLAYIEAVPVLSACLYLALSVAAGLFYPHRQRVFDALGLARFGPDSQSSGFLRVRWSWVDSSRLAEFVAGVCILGGLSVL